MGLCLSLTCDPSTWRLRSAPLQEADLDAPFPPPTVIKTLLDKVIKCVVTQVLAGNRCIILFVDNGSLFRQPILIEDYEPLGTSRAVLHLESLVLRSGEPYPLLFAKVCSLPRSDNSLSSVRTETAFGACDPPLGAHRRRQQQQQRQQQRQHHHQQHQQEQQQQQHARQQPSQSLASAAAAGEGAPHRGFIGLSGGGGGEGDGGGDDEDYGESGAEESAGDPGRSADLHCALYLDSRCRRSIATEMVEAGVGTTIKERVVLMSRRPIEVDENYATIHFPARGSSQRSSLCPSITTSSTHQAHSPRRMHRTSSLASEA